MKIKSLTEDGIEFDNGTKIRDYHDQECCERVYADWKQLEDTPAMSHDFNEAIVFEGVKDAGFRLDGFFIPCYDEQNGYYSSDLTIEISGPNRDTLKIDVSDYVEHKID